MQSAALKCKSWGNLSDKMTGLVGFFNHSQKSKDLLIADRSIENSKYHNYKIVQSCSTRWNSELHQLQSINELLPAIKIVENDVSQNLVNKIPGEKEFEQLRTIIELLKKFEELSNLASAENKVSICHSKTL